MTRRRDGVPAPRTRNARACTGLILFSLALSPARVLACSSCGCSLSTDWAGAVGTGSEAGLRVQARFDFVDQDRLRTGTHSSPKTPDTQPTDREYQQGTLTRFYILGADYRLDDVWSLKLQLPYLVREHQTIGEDQADAARSTSETRGLGDVQVLGRYQGFSEDRSWSLQFGLKLPTGSFRHRFATGPLADDAEIIDRGLQNGSGTTDLILGIDHTQALSRGWDRFEQLQFKQALDRRAGFRPSSQITAGAGLRYLGWPSVVPQLQINARIEGRETGSQADAGNSGSQVVYVTPGLSGGLPGGLTAFGFVQWPLYQHYTGYQLAPHYLVSVGLSHAF